MKDILKKHIRVAVTGAGGYLGRHVCAHLLKIGLRPYAIDIRNTGIDPRCDIVLSDIFSGEIDGCLKNVDCLIHLAWQNGFEHNSFSHIENLSNHFNFIREVVKHGCRSINIMGSMHEVGYWVGAVDGNTPCNPLSCYGVAKNALRQLCFAYIGKDVCLKWLRGFYIVGDDEKNNSIFGKMLKWDKEGRQTFPFTKGLGKYDFIDLESLAEQIVCASLQTEISGIINCCSGVAQSLRSKVEEFISVHKLNIRPEYGAFPERPYDSPCIYGDNSIITAILRTWNE